MLGRRLPKNRKFTYEPRFYDPQKEEREGRRIHFKRKTTRSAAKTQSLIWLITLLALVVYFIYFFGKLGR
jgi:hypothetical protein